MSSFEQINIDTDFLVLRFQNNTEKTEIFKKTVASSYIQFHFNLKGKAKFVFNEASYSLDLMEEKALLLYNPQKELPLYL